MQWGGAGLPTIQLRSVTIAVGGPGLGGRERDVTACSRLSEALPAAKAGAAE